jgi:hypothetical protein
MKTASGFVWLALTAGLAGCGGPPAGPPPALTVAGWQALPVEQKYTPETLEALKRGNPALETPGGWEAFRRTTLAAARKKDFAGRKR